MIENNNQDEWICRNNDGDLHGQELILDRKLDEILSDTDLLAFRKIMLKSCYKKPGHWYDSSLLDCSHPACAGIVRGSMADCDQAGSGRHDRIS